MIQNSIFRKLFGIEFCFPTNTCLHPQVSCSRTVWPPYQVGIGFLRLSQLMPQMFISAYFLKVSYKKEQGASSSLNSITILDQESACIVSLEEPTRFSTMQHFKVLFVLLFLAAVSISLTQAWTMNSKKVGKRKQLLPFSYQSVQP